MLVIVAVTGLLHQDMLGRAGNGGGESPPVSHAAGMRDTGAGARAGVTPLAKEAFLGRLGDSCGVYSVCGGDRDMAGVFLALVTPETNTGS